jgi:hypothetical protein
MYARRKKSGVWRPVHTEPLLQTGEADRFRSTSCLQTRSPDNSVANPTPLTAGDVRRMRKEGGRSRPLPWSPGSCQLHQYMYGPRAVTNGRCPTGSKRDNMHWNEIGVPILELLPRFDDDKGAGLREIVQLLLGRMHEDRMVDARRPTTRTPLSLDAT